MSREHRVGDDDHPPEPLSTRGRMLRLAGVALLAVVLLLAFTH